MLEWISSLLALTGVLYRNVMLSTASGINDSEVTFRSRHQKR